MSLIGPPPLSSNPLAVMLDDVRKERAATVPYPPGDLSFSLRRASQIAKDPLPALLDAYERHGPIFTLRILHSRIVFMIGAEANHFILLSNAKRFIWREGHFRELTALLGDGLLTIDGDFHRRSRRIMLPAFHREQIEGSVATIVTEAGRAIERLQPGERFDFFAWTRRLALRVAMRAIFGLDPDGELARSVDAAALFPQALSFYSHGPLPRMLRGPGSPWSRMQRARSELNRLIYGEIARRRASGERGLDVLSLLLDARDEDGAAFSDRQVRDEVMTLLFAGHDTTTATLSFMFYELARNPDLQAPLRAEQEAVLGGGATRRLPAAADLNGNGLPQLEMVLEETLRKYPPAWIGPRRSVEPFEFAGHTVPAHAYVNYSSWVTHHLPELYPEPERFDPERFTAERKAALPRGAYVPFGGGSRTCIGMRFGQVEIRAIASMLLAHCALELPEGFELRIREAPTIGPRGLPMRVCDPPRAPARVGRLDAGGPAGAERLAA
ncbi:MAG TPA: cytochrome P450 [Solirubrobacteraceae bacterium]|nr:cytochrome P450 [Solirubrobacteraceae bacterium]